MLQFFSARDSEPFSKGVQNILTSRDAHCLIRSDNKRIGASKITIQEVTEIVNVVIGREYACVNFICLHVVSYHVQTALHFLGRESRFHL